MAELRRRRRRVKVKVGEKIAGATVPTALDERMLGRIEQAAKGDASDAQIAALVGISPSTLWKWKQRHPEFANDLERWRQSPLQAARAVLVGRIIAKDLKAAMYLLDRRDPRYHPKATVASPDRLDEGTWGDGEPDASFL